MTNPCKQCIVGPICERSCDKLYDFVNIFFQTVRPLSTDEVRMVGSMIRISSIQSSEVVYHTDDFNKTKIEIIFENGEVKNVKRNREPVSM